MAFLGVTGFDAISLEIAGKIFQSTKQRDKIMGKCTICGAEMGQKTICPSCGEKSMRATGIIDVTPVVPESSSSPMSANAIALKHSQLEGETVTVNLKEFLDKHGNNWQIAFEQEFSTMPFDDYEKIYNSCCELQELRQYLLKAVRSSKGDRITPPYLLATLKAFYEKFPDMQVEREAIRQWFVELFQQEADRQIAFQKFAFSFDTGEPFLGKMVYVNPALSPAEGHPELSKPIWIMENYVRGKAWNTIMGSEQFGKNVVHDVTWEDAMIFCRKLTAYNHTKHTIPENYEYTLPERALMDACGTGKNYHSELQRNIVYSSDWKEWLWEANSKNPSERQVVVVGSSDLKNTVFSFVHMDYRDSRLGFRCMLAPVRPDSLPPLYENRNEGNRGLTECGVP